MQADLILKEPPSPRTPLDIKRLWPNHTVQASNIQSTSVSGGFVS